MPSESLTRLYAITACGREVQVQFFGGGYKTADKREMQANIEVNPADRSFQIKISQAKVLI